MTTVLKIGRRRCDGRCHFALEKACDCVCGGENHGRGLKVEEEAKREIDGQGELFPPRPRREVRA